MYSGLVNTKLVKLGLGISVVKMKGKTHLRLLSQTLDPWLEFCQLKESKARNSEKWKYANCSLFWCFSYSSVSFS